MSLIAERMHTTTHGNYEDFIFENGDLLDKAVLKRWYSTTRLQSDVARRVFLMPTVADYMNERRQARFGAIGWSWSDCVVTRKRLLGWLRARLHASPRHMLPARVDVSLAKGTRDSRAGVAVMAAFELGPNVGSEYRVDQRASRRSPRATLVET